MPKKAKGEGNNIIVDCMKYYIPREHAVALAVGAKIREPGKSGDAKANGKVKNPRLKHRPDGRLYVNDGGLSNDKVYVLVPQKLNPSKSSIIKICVTVYWPLFDNRLDGIIGKFNTVPIQKWNGLEEHQSKEPCLIRDSCEFAPNYCHCVWGPYQILIWGRMINGSFVPLPSNEVIRSQWLSLSDLRDRVKLVMSAEEWAVFRDKPTKSHEDMIPPSGPTDTIMDNIAAEKIYDNLRTRQRVDFSTANCYGLSMYQFALSFDTRFDNNLKAEVCFVVNQREPVVENRRQAQSRLNEKEHEKNPEVAKPQPKPKKPKKKVKVKADPALVSDVLIETKTSETPETPVTVFNDDGYVDNEDGLSEFGDELVLGDDDSDNF